MKRKESSASNPRSNAREDDYQKAEANRRAAINSRSAPKTSRGSAEEGRERDERERIASADSRQAADNDDDVNQLMPFAPINARIRQIGKTLDEGFEGNLG